MVVPVVFCGTPEFAIPSLERLHVETEIDIRGVISRPDKPKGRKRALSPTPLKARAQELGLEVFQPARLKNPEVTDWFHERSPAAVVVIAYGGLVPPGLLRLPPLGCINLHPSLLPKYRGAAPVQWSLINGDAVTGICSMYLSEGWDDGDLIYSQEVPIEPDEDAGSLLQRLSHVGADLIFRTILDVAAGSAPREPQDDSLVTWAPKIEPHHEPIDWTQSASQIHGLVRGLSPSPGAHTTCGAKRLKVFRTEVVHAPLDSAPGSVFDTSMGTIRVAAGQGGLDLLEVQPDGKRRMRTVDYLRGHAIEPGVVLGG